MLQLAKRAIYRTRIGRAVTHVLGSARRQVRAELRWKLDVERRFARQTHGAAVSLVGRFATPVSASERICLGPFRDAPKLLSVEPDQQKELVDFVAGKAAASTAIDAPVLSLVNRLESNYYHWLCEWLPRVRDLPAEATVLIGSEAVPIATPSLLACGIAQDHIRTWPGRGVATVSRLLHRPLDGHRPSAASLHWVRERLLDAARRERPDLSEGPPLKLYVPRRVGGWRYVVNDDELSEALTRIGFTRLDPAAHDLLSQVALFSRAQVVVGLHGSGLTNGLFSTEGRFFEMHGTYYDEAFKQVILAVGNEHRFVPVTPDADNVRVDVQKILRIVG